PLSSPPPLSLPAALPIFQNPYPPPRPPLSTHQILRSPIIPHQSLLRPKSPVPPSITSNPAQPRTPLQNPQSLTLPPPSPILPPTDRKSTRLNSSHVKNSY